jgi:hypothetical protein
MIDSFVKTKSRNVGYKLLQSSGDKLAKNADEYGNGIQNIVNTVLNGMSQMLENHDFHTTKYVGTPLEAVATHLSALDQPIERNINTTVPLVEMKSKGKDAYGTL